MSSESMVARPDINARELKSDSWSWIKCTANGYALDSLVVHLSCLYMRRDWRSAISKLRNIRRSRDVDPFRMEVQRRVCGRERGQQAVVHIRVEQFCALGEEQLAQVMQPEARL